MGKKFDVCDVNFMLGNKKNKRQAIERARLLTSGVFSPATSFIFIFTTLTLIEGLIAIASSLIFLFFCVESFFMLHILFRFLMLKRDGKWRLLVIYNRSVQATKGNIRLTQTPTQAIFIRDVFFFSLHTLCHFFIFLCLLLFFFFFCCRFFLRTDNKNLKSKSLQEKKKRKNRRERNEIRIFLCCTIIAVSR